MIDRRKGFGTAPVFFTAVSTILGAILFLRFGYAVAHVGLWGTMALIVLGHLVTIPTAMAIAEIATNQRVEGGGAYYIISRSFGITTGAAIGIALFLSQAISVAFYSIAFAEAFRPVFVWINTHYGSGLTDLRIVSLPATLFLALLVMEKGASLGMKVLYLVVATLAVSLVLLFVGDTGYAPPDNLRLWTITVAEPDAFFKVFAIIFPAFTGVTAGLGLSGDLRNPKRAIPVGTLTATVCGMSIYVAVAVKLALSASPEQLASDQLFMSQIAIWGPIIPIGLAAATFSSALGSILVAPRTLQALGADEILPTRIFNRWMRGGKGSTNEPYNATLVTLAIALFFVVIGDVDFVAEIITMFFMVTYGAVCLISFLEHFAADPSYRPAFRSRWYISLLGAIACIWFMFKINALYAWIAIAIMLLTYIGVANYAKDRQGLANIFQGVIFQLSRRFQIFLQKARREGEDSWRPSVVCISADSFSRLAAFDLLRWISHRYGFGTYIHYISGYFSKATHDESKEVLDRLVRMAHVSESNVFVDTMVSPSYTTAVAQLIQLPSISGKDNNLLLFEFGKSQPEEAEQIVANYALAISAEFDICVLAASDRGYGYKHNIHIWLTPADYENAKLMILLGYIILGHREWRGGEIHIFTLVPEKDLDEQRRNLETLVRDGRLPISSRNIETIPLAAEGDKRTLINTRSKDADLVMMGFRGEALKRQKGEIFRGFDAVGNVLFVNTTRDIEIDRVVETPTAELPAVESSPREMTSAEAETVEPAPAKPTDTPE